MKRGTMLVCGGRTYSDQANVDSVLDFLSPTFIVHGGAKGADSLAGDWAARHHVPTFVVYPDWKRYGKAAGGIRNQEMIDSMVDDGVQMIECVLAFPGGAGTADMIRRAKKAGIQVMIAPDGKKADAGNP